MLPIPNTEKRFLQPNNSDRFGNIHYTKNQNFDEEGYVKLSPRALALISSTDDTDFDIPAAFGRRGSGQFYIAGIDDPFEAQIAETAVTAAQDTDADGSTPPALTIDSHGAWFNNLWHVTEDQLIVYKTPSNGNWTDTAVALTTGKIHALAEFESRRTLCVTNGNQVLQVDTSYASSTTLTLPAKFEAVALCYANTKMGVITKMNDSVSGMGGQAYFFVWSGAATEAGSGFPTGSDSIVGIVPYASWFLLLTRTGQGLYFNGGGFETLFSLPHYYLDLTWGDSINREALGDIMRVEGDVVYFNLNNAMEPYGEKSEEYIPHAPGGILCYDPKVGLYHRYSPSISKAVQLTVTQANVNTSTDIMTETGSNAIPATGNPVKYIFDKTSRIGGLVTGRVYYIIKHTATTFSLAATREDAVNGVKINLTSTGAANNYFLALTLKDYGPSRLARTGAIELAEANTHALDRMVFGGELYASDDTDNDEYLNFICTGFPNIGYIVSSRTLSDQVTDTQQELLVRYRPLKTTDSIIVKKKTRAVLGLPVSTPQASVHCTWTDANTFTTTADLSEADAYLDTAEGELECEIISGSGAGQLSQISSITESGGTYTVNLADELEGVAANDVCDVLIDSWEQVGVITSDDVLGDVKLPIGASDKSFTTKVIMKGIDVTIEEIRPIAIPHQVAQEAVTEDEITQ